MKTWAFILIIAAFSLLYAHFLQEFLFMRPCEQCVYLRFAMCVMILGSIFGLLGEFFGRKALNLGVLKSENLGLNSQNLNTQNSNLSESLNTQNAKFSENLNTKNLEFSKNLNAQNAEFSDLNENSPLSKTQNLHGDFNAKFKNQSLSENPAKNQALNSSQNLGSNFAQIFAKFLQILAFLTSFWGVYLGFKHAFLLNQIHAALKSGDPFGVSGCSQTPHFPLSLPLDKLAPSFFTPNGACGLDAPFVPEGADLNALQSLFLGTLTQNFTDGFYSNGWYLVPSLEFINMATACALIFGLFAVILVVKFTLFARRNLKPNFV